MIMRAILCSLFLSVSFSCFPVSAQAFAADCIGGVSLGAFRILATSASGKDTIGLSAVNVLRARQQLRYEPVDLPKRIQQQARVALVVVAKEAGEADQVEVLGSHSANQAAEWTMPFDVAVVGVVLGPQGLDTKKVNSLVKDNHQVMSQLADYAEKTAQVDALVSTLRNWEQGPSNQHSLDAALMGFSSRYGVGLPKLDAAAPADQQAAVLLRALLPTISSYDPLTTDPSVRAQQSVGLAASVAALFFGTPVSLAAGGAVLFQNLRTLMFPDTDFRSASAQLQSADIVTLCSKQQPTNSRTRQAYLWALRLPESSPPRVTVSPDLHIPIGPKWNIPISTEPLAQQSKLSRLRHWQLKADNGASSFPLRLSTSGTALEPDVSEARIVPGMYRLLAQWDWELVEATNAIHLDALGNLRTAQVTSTSSDQLVFGKGRVPISLRGADFQFVDKVSLLQDSEFADPPLDLPFKLPLGKRAGPQFELNTELDTRKLEPGSYQLVLTQSGSEGQPIPITITGLASRYSQSPTESERGDRTALSAKRNRPGSN